MTASETPNELRAPVEYLRRFFPCPHWTTVEAHPSLCANCGMDNGESCPIRQACDQIDVLLARLTAVEAENANLARWKAEAMAVLTEWDVCHDILEAVGRGAPIGRSKARHVAEYLKRQTGAE